MITLHNYQPIPRRRINWTSIALSALGHVAIGSLLAYTFLGMAGWL